MDSSISTTTPIKIEHKSHPKNSSPSIKINLKKTDEEIGQKRIEIEQKRIEIEQKRIQIDAYVKDLRSLLPLALVTFALFFIAYRKSSGYSVPLLAVGFLALFLLERLLPIYDSMPKSHGKLVRKLMIWLLSTAIALVIVLLISNVWKLSSESAFAADMIVLIVCVFSLYGWLIVDIVSYWKKQG